MIKPILLKIAVAIISAIFHLNGAALPPSHPIRQRYEAAADDLVTAARLEGLSETNPTHLKIVRVAFVWSYYEASWYSRPRGYNDKGDACGVGQIHPSSFPAWVLEPAWTCEAMRADRVVGYHAQLRAIQYFLDKCGGDLEAAMTAYSMRGACPKGWTIPLVRSRCLEAGGC